MFAKKTNGYAYLCETRVGYPILDQQRDSVVKARHPLELKRGGQGGGDNAGEDDKHYCG